MELMPLLEKSAEALGESRIVNHSSIARMNPSKELKAEYLEKNGGKLGGDSASMFFGGARWLRYNQTKLANASFTAALHERLQKKAVQSGDMPQRVVEEHCRKRCLKTVVWAGELPKEKEGKMPMLCTGPCGLFWSYVEG
ncbi:MAG: hypothetical protein EBS53_18785 [Bacteroidetes bacterium]|nr:hypothetical protein [Bacteroidota bacterium]